MVPVTITYRPALSKWTDLSQKMASAVLTNFKQVVKQHGEVRIHPIVPRQAHDGAGGARVETLQNMLLANNEGRGAA